MTLRKPEVDPEQAATNGPRMPNASDLEAAARSSLALVRADLGLPGLRWLGPGDGHLLVELVRACYGDTYSYVALYRAGEIDALWAQGSLFSLGHFDEDGARGAAALWIEMHRCLVEDGDGAGG